MSDKFEWSDSYLLGYGPMDETHKEFVLLVDAMKHASDADFSARLDAFEKHAVKHFSEEDEWMTSTSFPSADCHIEEHGKVLASVHGIQAMDAEKKLKIGRGLVTALEEWFPGHADYLDSALAKWMVKQSFGGARVAPVVFKRNPKMSETGVGEQSKNP
ncbi:hemerythrin domain-containing protein [Rugosibacter aromaticivorans]|uniref:hemerythrin domain-containing protein n=1 Tax=Rugosibacter aromaticivorans TaxID=1565605 RepID=UPI000A6FB955|nr:hemerythrin domain-containing protein [Rugosibacter aromaticivorans]TBR16045.1 MAG: hemerythrin [Rugosibacter sp.]